MVDTNQRISCIGKDGLNLAAFRIMTKNRREMQSGPILIKGFAGDMYASESIPD